MAAEIIISQRSSGKLLNHAVFQPLLDRFPDLSATFVASFFAACLQKAFLPLRYFALRGITISIAQGENAIVLVLSESSSERYLMHLAHQVLVYANTGEYARIELEMNQINMRVLRQLVKQLKRIDYITGVCLFVKELGLELEENYRGGYVQKEWEDLKDGDIVEKWLGEEYLLYSNEYVVALQFDKNIIFCNMADVEITRGGNIAGFDGFTTVRNRIYALLGDIECCIDRIV